jgi:heptosyltransferase I
VSERLDGKSLCIVMMSALGDTVHVLPLVCALKRHAPSLRITWVLEPGGAALMTGHPLVDEIVVHRKGVKALAGLRSRMRGRSFDLLLDLQVAMKAGLATAMIPSPRKIGFDRGRARDMNQLFTNERIAPHAPQHVQDQYIEFLTHLGVPAEPLEWNLGPWPGEHDLGAHLLKGIERPMASLAIATSWDEKDWFAERWAALADELWTSRGLQPVLLGGSSEKERRISDAITQAVHCPVVSTLGCTLRELVGVIHASALVISPDTAPMHMAVALNVPVIGLMGYTNPKRVGPYRKFHDLLVDAYGDPGEDYRPSLEYRLGRMERIQVRDVLEKVDVWSGMQQR